MDEMDKMDKIKARHQAGFFCNSCLLVPTCATVFLLKRRKCGVSRRRRLTGKGAVAQ